MLEIVFSAASNWFNAHPEAAVFIALVTAFMFLQLAYYSWLARYNAAHPSLELPLDPDGVEGRLCLRFDVLESTDLGYGPLKYNADYRVTAHSPDGKRLPGGKAIFLTARSKRDSYSKTVPNTVQLNEQDLYRLGVKQDNTDWPKSVRLKAAPAETVSIWYWWNHNDPTTKLTIRLTTIVLGLQELVLPFLKDWLKPQLIALVRYVWG